MECMAFKSACIPAPPPESEPAMVYTIDGLIVGILISLVVVVVVVAVDGDEAANANTAGTSVVIYSIINDMSK